MNSKLLVLFCWFVSFFQQSKTCPVLLVCVFFSTIKDMSFVIIFLEVSASLQMAVDKI